MEDSMWAASKSKGNMRERSSRVDRWVDAQTSSSLHHHLSLLTLLLLLPLLNNSRLATRPFHHLPREIPRIINTHSSTRCVIRINFLFINVFVPLPVAFQLTDFCLRKITFLWARTNSCGPLLDGLTTMKTSDRFLV